MIYPIYLISYHAGRGRSLFGGSSHGMDRIVDAADLCRRIYHMCIDIPHFRFNAAGCAFDLSDRISGFFQQPVQAVSDYLKFIAGCNIQYLCEIPVIGCHFKNFVVYFDKIASHSDCNEQSGHSGKQYCRAHCKQDIADQAVQRCLYGRSLIIYRHNPQHFSVLKDRRVSAVESPPLIGKRILCHGRGALHRLKHGILGFIVFRIFSRIVRIGIHYKLKPIPVPRHKRINISNRIADQEKTQTVFHCQKSRLVAFHGCCKDFPVHIFCGNGCNLHHIIFTLLLQKTAHIDVGNAPHNHCDNDSRP